MSQLHRFFYNGPMEVGQIVSLEAETAKHIWQVLRMDPDDNVLLTDGVGKLAQGAIQATERHKCNVRIHHIEYHDRVGSSLHLCIAFTKNNSRNEWLLEKATELGVASITPIIAFRSEKTHVREERWSKILQSAVLQSQQHYVPLLREVTPLHLAIEDNKETPQKLVAHCISDDERLELAKMLKPGLDTTIFIGPEGDFSKEEVNLLKGSGYIPVSFGRQRLRTETAAIVGASYFKVINDGND